jgi:hypothetical protein
MDNLTVIIFGKQPWRLVALILSKPSFFGETDGRQGTGPTESFVVSDWGTFPRLTQTLSLLNGSFDISTTLFIKGNFHQGVIPVIADATFLNGMLGNGFQETAIGEDL